MGPKATWRGMTMKTLLIVLVLVSCVLAGCTSVETTREHHDRLMLTGDLQFRALVEDWDYFWLAERNCRLTKWPTRLGYQ